MRKYKAANMAEYAVFSCIIMIILFVILIYISNNSNILNEPGKAAIMLLLIGATIGGIGWSGQKIYEIIEKQTQLLIIELLSIKEPLTRKEITKEIIRKGLIYWLFRDVQNVALSSLISENKVGIKNNTYYLLNIIE